MITSRLWHTIMRNVGLVWVTSAQRWYVPEELFVSMGFPVTSEAIAACGVDCQFSRTRPSEDVSSLRSRRSSVQQVGNGMHVNVIGSVLATISLYFPEAGSEFFA